MLSATARTNQMVTFRSPYGLYIEPFAKFGIGPDKVWCHLMFGILTLTVEQLMCLML